MTLLYLVLALVIEQTWPLRRRNPLYAAYEQYAALLEQRLNGQQAIHGVIAWLLAVVPLALVVVLVQALLHGAGVLFELAWGVAVLYVAMGFRRFSHYFTEIAQALREEDIGTARDALGRWRGTPADALNAAEVSRVAIELGLIQAHRYVLGPIFWLIVLGPVGVVIYRAAELLATSWGDHVVATEPGGAAFADFAQRAHFWIDWLPARLTASAFGFAGNFEDAAYCWRTQAAGWGHGAEGVVLASGAGALGVRLGGPLHEDGLLLQRADLGLGNDVEIEDLRGAVGLIWRALSLWLVLILVGSVAAVFG
jgi:adenosylcobinamide-phosphate synthase